LVYDAAKTQLALVAKGEETSTIVSVESSNTYEYNDVYLIFYSLIRDCPSEMYWSDEKFKYTNEETEDGNYVLNLYISVDKTYRKDTSDQYTTDNSDGSRIKSANKAIENAKKIVSDAEGKSDYEKLRYYADTLCDMNTYYWDATYDDYSGSYDPWQIIYILDGDTTTNVVCVGYSKAFQYLCEMTEFDDDIICYCANGRYYMTYEGEKSDSYSHMWNIIQMDDGKNYLVDLTNMDQDEEEDDYYIDSFFIGYVQEGSVDTGYTILAEYLGYNFEVTYIYSSTSTRLYTEDELTLSSTEYEPPMAAPVPDPIPEPDHEPDSNYDSDSNDESGQYSGATLSGAVSTVNRQPIIEAYIGESSVGWDSLSYEIGKAESKNLSTLNVYLNGTEIIPTSAMSKIADKNMAFNILVNANTLVTIDGNQFTNEEASDVKLITGKSIDGNNTLGVRSQNADILKSMIIYSYIGTEYIGSDTTLYFVNQDNSLVEFRNSMVYDNGFTAFITPLVNANYITSIKIN
jgi:hypothetical protein